MTEETVANVKSIVADETGESVTIDTDFAGLGIDSLDFLCIVQRVRNEVGPISDKVIGSINTVGDLAAAVGI